jgi:homoisocitrate dehydrogenase
LSDVVAALTGGLGVSAGINMNETFAIAEPVHGSAPDIVGKNIANPIATFRSIGLLLNYISKNNECGIIINNAINNAYKYKLNLMTPDIGGSGNTISCIHAILDCLEF